eukprot:scaffold45837_cov26-Tisochrysis_lutea.AAC.1
MLAPFSLSTACSAVMCLRIGAPAQTAPLLLCRSSGVIDCACGPATMARPSVRLGAAVSNEAIGGTEIDSRSGRLAELLRESEEHPWLPSRVLKDGKQSNGITEFLAVLVVIRDGYAAARMVPNGLDDGLDRSYLAVVALQEATAPSQHVSCCEASQRLESRIHVNKRQAGPRQASEATKSAGVKWSAANRRRQSVLEVEA